MPESIKAYTNRCRTCLEKFYFDEKPSKITGFFKSQFKSFTLLELYDDEDYLSNFVCEFCHQELLRFSCFKKDLIEKQQKLLDLLKQQKEKSEKSAKVRTKIIREDVISPLQSKTEIDDMRKEEKKLVLPEVDEKEDFFIVPANQSLPIKKEILPIVSELYDKGDFKCDKCDLNFKAKRGLARHVQSHIENSAPWKCNICNFSGKSRDKLKAHKKQVHENIPGTEQAIKKEVTALLPVEGKTKGSKYTCLCGKSFPNIRSLRSHRSRDHPGGYKKCTFGCKNVQYVKMGHFIRHVQSRHPERLEDVLNKVEVITPIGTPTRFLQCDKCSFRTLRKSSIRSHLERHLPVKERKKPECKICFKQFTRPTSLRIHCESVHKMPKKIKCPKCTDVFKFASHLNDHIKFKHKKIGKKHFRCSFCPLMFMNRSSATRHMSNVHKNSRSSSVTIPIKAKKIVQRKIQLNSEKDGKHKNFPCTYAGCSHKFTARCNLIRHQKQKGHLPAEELKRIKFNCDCGEKFFSYRGYEHHCDKTKCLLKKTKISENI